MADPMAALAVARKIASAAISTVSEREIASLFFVLIIWKIDSFGSWFRLVYIA